MPSNRYSLVTGIILSLLLIIIALCSMFNIRCYYDLAQPTKVKRMRVACRQL